MASKTSKQALVVSMTAGQKAAATKKLKGLDLSAIAHKAAASRRANEEAAESAAISPAIAKYAAESKPAKAGKSKGGTPA